MSDHFSAVADGLPLPTGYPPELFAWLAGLPERRRLAWDCATGNGQAALGLAGPVRAADRHDGSAAQIAHATPHPGSPTGCRRPRPRASTTGPSI